MKALKMITVSVLLLVLSLSQTSCLIVSHRDSGSGGRKGWYKNSNNPHHPNTTNPGKAKGHKNK